jgi:hypothetical protein
MNCSEAKLVQCNNPNRLRSFLESKIRSRLLNNVFWIFQAFDLPEPPAKTATPEELMRATKPVTLATAKAVAAGTSLKQDDIIVAANMGRKAISDLLTTCKGAAYNAESGELKRKTLEAGHNCAETYRELLRMVMQILMKPGQEGRHHLTEISRNIAACVQDIVTSSEQLKGIPLYISLKAGLKSLGWRLSVEVPKERFEVVVSLSFEFRVEGLTT